MIKRIVYPRAIVLVAAGALSAAAVSVSTIAQMDAAKSSVTATGKQFGAPMDIRFGKFDATVNYNPTDMAASMAKIDIDAASVDVSSKGHNDELKKKDWFDIAKYPKAMLVSSTFEPGTGGKVDVAGELTIKGITQDVTAPVMFKQEGANQVLKDAFPIRHNTFRIGGGEQKDTSVVSDDMTIKFRVIVAKK